MADERDAVLDDDLVLFGERAVAALLGGHVDDHRAGFHALDHVFGNQHRRRAAGDERRGDDDISLLDAFGDQRGLALEPGFRHRPRIAAYALRRFAFLVGLERDIDELGAEGLHLLLGGGAHVGGFDHRTQALGGGDRLQAGHAHAHDDRTRRLDGAGRGHEHRHDLGVVGRCGENRDIAAQVGLR